MSSKFTDKIVLLVAFVLSLATIVFLVYLTGAEDVRMLGLVPLVLVLGGALAALVRQQPPE